jgi:catechol 2,3-dioxygenase-like lactoylglutathione lyase family enzyme
MTDWFARPVLHVSSVEASLRFYVDKLGFSIAWRFEEDGGTRVAQVDRGRCALIPPTSGRKRSARRVMFISLNVEPATYEAEVAAVDVLRAELEASGVEVQDGRRDGRTTDEADQSRFLSTTSELPTCSWESR